MFESDVLANSRLALSNSDPIVTLPLNTPGCPATAGIANDLRGCLASTTPVGTEMLSLSVTPNTVTLGWAARRGSSTVISIVSLQSYTARRSTVSVAHCWPAGFPSVPKPLQAGGCGGTNALSSTGCTSSHSSTGSSKPMP